MPIIDNPKLYNQVKHLADKLYSKPSAYKSGFLVKKYKELGGTYSDDKEPKNLKRWFQEDWKDIGDKEYPVYRPTKRINKNTPLTPNEIKPSNLKKQIDLKQIIMGNYNLRPFVSVAERRPKFEGKGLSPNGDLITKSDPKGRFINLKSVEILEYSNPTIVFKKARKYLGKDVKIELSKNKNKKYMIFNPNTEKWINFGQMGYEDFTKHKDPVRRHNYLTRTANMKGNWKDNPYSPNNLSRNILW
jgi:hypothetical protein